MQRIILAQKVECRVERYGGRRGRVSRPAAARRFAVGSGSSGSRRASPAARGGSGSSRRGSTPRAIAAEGRLRLGIERGVSIRQQRPLLSGPMPLEDSPQRMAVVTSGAYRFVRNDLILDAVFGHIHDRFGLFRRKSVRRAQVLDDYLGIGRLQGEAIQANHALDGFLPAFRGCANPRNPAEIPFVVLGVAACALTDGQVAHP